MKFPFIFLATLLFFFKLNICQAQAPAVQWSKTYGGSGKDYGNCIRQTFDSGFIAIGRTYSDDGQVTGYHADEDIWITRLDKGGTLQWQMHGQ